MVARNKTKMFSGGLHLNIYAQKPLGLPKLAIKNQNFKKQKLTFISIKEGPFNASDNPYNGISNTKITQK